MENVLWVIAKTWSLSHTLYLSKDAYGRGGQKGFPTKAV